MCYTTRPQWSPFKFDVIGLSISLRYLMLSFAIISWCCLYNWNVLTDTEIIWIEEILQEENVANNVDRVRFKGIMAKLPIQNKLSEQYEIRRTTRRNRLLESTVFVDFV